MYRLSTFSYVYIIGHKPKLMINNLFVCNIILYSFNEVTIEQLKQKKSSLFIATQ